MFIMAVKNYRKPALKLAGLLGLRKMGGYLLCMLSFLVYFVVTA